MLLVEGWARDGLTNEQIAKNIGINKDTLYEWKNKYSDFNDALKKGKEVADRMVENALFKRAIGYSYKETTKEISKVTGKLVVTKEVTKEVVPDTTAQIFWLKNRKTAEWRDRRNNDEYVNDENVDDGFMYALEAAAKDDWNAEKE